MFRSFKAAAGLLLLAALEVSANPAPVEYLLDLPANRMISYTLPLDVREPGQLVVEAEWPFERVLTLRIQPPEGNAVRRSGPSPQRVAVDVPAELVGGDEPWVLSVRGLPSRNAGEGRLRVFLPRAPQAVPRPTAALPVEEPESEPWKQPRKLPTKARSDQRALYESVESFRALVVDGESRPDSCRWQSDFLRFAARARDAHIESGTIPGDDSKRMYRRIVEAIVEVERLRVSDDPLMQPPPGATGRQLQAWQMVFERRLDPLRASLDDLLHDLADGRAPDLEGERWPRGYVGCLVACERFFEERRLDGPAASTNRRLAEDQWERIVAAGRVIEALSRLGGAVD